MASIDHDSEDLELPAALAREFSMLASAPLNVPAEIDQAILARPVSGSHEPAGDK